LLLDRLSLLHSLLHRLVLLLDRSQLGLLLLRLLGLWARQVGDDVLLTLWLEWGRLAELSLLEGSWLSKLALLDWCWLSELALLDWCWLSELALLDGGRLPELTLLLDRLSELALLC